MSNLCHMENVEVYNNMYKTMQHDHEYPNINLVRLEKWFLKKPGKVLDHGCGYGENLIFLTKRGYQVHGVDVSEDLINWVKVKCKIKQVPESLCSLSVLGKEQASFGESESYDHVISLGVLEMLSDRKSAELCIEKLLSVLKPGGKMILSTLHFENTFVMEGEKIAEEEFLFVGTEKDKDIPLEWRLFIPKSVESLKTLFPKECEVQEVGFWDNEYCGVKGKHYCALVTKK